MIDARLRARLRRILTERFSDDELQTLCFDMGVDYDNLPGTAKAGKARELVARCERHDQIPDLIATGKELRPDIDWDAIVVSTEAETSTSSPPVAQQTPITDDTPSLRALRVFLAHSTNDKPKVRQLYQQLQQAGLAPWLDEEDLLPGQSWQPEIRKAVRNADVVIVCLSQAAITGAGYVHTEIGFALDVADQQPEGTIFLIPLRLEACDVPERLRHLHWVDLFDERGFTRLLRALRVRAQTIGAVMNAPDAHPVAEPPRPAPPPAVQPSPDQHLNPIRAAIAARTFTEALNQLEQLLQRHPDDRAAAMLTASLIENPQVPLEQRIQAARLVADNDPRPGLNLEQPDYWAQRIEPGPFLMGDDNSEWDYEKPAFVYQLKRSYALARYPVTNQQYARFLADLEHNGKHEEAECRQPRYGWKDGCYLDGEGNHPVVDVNWEDACAFAAWVNDLLHQKGILKAGEEVRLPTEPEWERAAAYPVLFPDGAPGAGRRNYPWGNWSSGLANTRESGIQGTSAVGLFPQGAADCGALDLAGNVWEWCSTPFQMYPLPDELQAESMYTTRDYKSRTYVLRGGSWDGAQSDARCASRFYDSPDDGYVILSFRLAHLFSFL